MRGMEFPLLKNTIMKSKSKKELILETVNLYSKNPQKRGVNTNGSCYYLAPNGNRCAVGRIMSAKGLDKYGDFRGDYSQLACSANLENTPREILFKPSYREVAKDSSLLSILQSLHDDMLVMGADKTRINKPIIQHALRRLAQYDYLSEAEAEELTETVINNLERALQ